MKSRLVAVIFFFSFPLFAQDHPTSEADNVQSIVKALWIDFNLGDIEKIPALGRPEDLHSIPAYKGEEAEAMKMKDLPQLSETRREISQEVMKAFVFSKPIIAQDGKSADLTITTVVSEARPLRELKMIYASYMGFAYNAQKSGEDFPTLESIKTAVLAPGLPAQKKIDEDAAELAKQKPYHVLLEKTPAGWKMNLQDFFEKN